jgi:hypothetical protein
MGVCPGAPQNACWTGNEISYGDGGGDYHPFAGSLDVVAHELNHGFTQFHSDLAYDGQSGALNESFSDIAGTCAEFYFGAGGDFEIGEDIYQPGALRYMCDPAKDGSSIGDLGDYQDGMDVHHSSGLPNRAFCLTVGRFRVVGEGADPVGAVQMVGEIWYAANASFWTSASDFTQACRGTLDAARSLGYGGDAVQALADSWADTGVACDSKVSACNNDGTCDAAGGESCLYCGEDCGPCGAGGGGGGGGCGDGVCDGDETDATCGMDCGCASFGGSCADGQPAPFGCYCDSECAENGDCCADAGACGG